ncbi:uncharacterized protein LOC106090116 [Stomoxys calcitrans]|uniref:Uncharacterized protein n=1 Tax=Stomoxys calcitrans TaxID=35570 RepID=A0A1I8NW01_STOCA|nr:uncharacterized protein LOC106090116 [Stomoxys calcitrans]
MTEPKTTTTISASFLDYVWPQILEQIFGGFQNEDEQQYFVPEIKFDNLWSHILLASKSFGNYDKPVELNCKKVAQMSEEMAAINIEVQQLPYRPSESKIKPLDVQLAAIDHDMKLRKNLANDYFNRTFPWYIEIPSSQHDFSITNDTRKIFSNPFEFKIIENIQKNRCSLMIIDVAINVNLEGVERWMKFASYAEIVMAIRNAELYSKIKNGCSRCKAILIEEYPENTWQYELNKTLRSALEFARKLHLIEDADSFVFAFSSQRNICITDKFKVLKEL